jgi:hypothetical protein
MLFLIVLGLSKLIMGSFLMCCTFSSKRSHLLQYAEASPSIQMDPYRRQEQLLILHMLHISLS